MSFTSTDCNSCGTFVNYNKLENVGLVNEILWLDLTNGVILNRATITGRPSGLWQIYGQRYTVKAQQPITVRTPAHGIAPDLRGQSTYLLDLETNALFGVRH